MPETALDRLGLDRLSLHALLEVTPHSAWAWFIGKPLSIVITVLAAVILRWLALRSIGRVVAATLARSDARRPGEGSRAGRVLAQATGSAHERHRQRTLTMGSLLRSMVTFFVVLITILTILSTVGIDLGPVLATAGVGGVALGFGAQSLVKDFLSGFFVLVEDQYGVGDVITIADTTGTVEEINLRVTRLRAVDGTVWFVPNGEIRKVGNSAKEWSRSIVDVIVPNRADLAAATAAIAEEVAALAKDPAWVDAILEEPEVLGVESLGAEHVTVRVSTKTTPAHRAPLAREMRSRISGRLQRDGLVASAAEPAGGPTPSS